MTFYEYLTTRTFFDNIRFMSFKKRPYRSLNDLLRILICIQLSVGTMGIGHELAKWAFEYFPGIE